MTKLAFHVINSVTQRKLSNYATEERAKAVCNMLNKKASSEIYTVVRKGGRS